MVFVSRREWGSSKRVPLHSICRWTSWFGMIKFVYQYYDYVVGFFRKEQLSETESSHVNQVVETFDTIVKCQILHIRLCFVAENSGRFLSDINFFQSKNAPICPFVYDRIQQLEAFLLHGDSIHML